MNLRASLDPRLLEALSAYLDGRLKDAERMALEDRLKKDEDLRRQLSELRAVRDSLRSLPVLRSPRALTLSQSQVGVSARRPAAFSPRLLTWGSALASLAFVAVLSLDVFSRGFPAMGAATQPAALEMLKAPEAAAADKSQPPEGRSQTAGEATLFKAPEPTVAPVPKAAAATQEISSESPVEPTPTSATMEDGCGVQLHANNAADRCGLTTGFISETEKPSFSLPDFYTAAPYLEAFLGFTAVLLAVLAFLLRRTR